MNRTPGAQGTCRPVLRRMFWWIINSMRSLWKNKGPSQRDSLSIKAVVVALTAGVFMPILLSTSVGIVTLALGERSDPLIVGVLIISFTAAGIGGATALTVLLGRRARRSRIQADLLANVSHELRTPLTTIRLYAQTLRSGRIAADPARTIESLDVIVRETEWLEAMIERILTWRAAARDLPPVPLENATVGPAVGLALERFRRMIDPTSATLEISLESRAPVQIGADMITVAVLNLLVNAFRYGGPKPWIALRTRDLEDAVTIEVEDRGVGIPHRDQRRVFCAFHRVRRDGPGTPPGTGLGLAIVDFVVKAHGAVITLDSTPDRGSRFTITLSRSSSEGHRAPEGQT